MKCLYLGKNKITKIQNLDSLHTLEVLSLQVGGTTVSCTACTRSALSLGGSTVRYTAFTRSAQSLGGWHYCQLHCIH